MTPSDQLLGLPRLGVELNAAFVPVRPLIQSGRIVSFNARISVSRVGEAGRPFTVVASSLDDLGRALVGLIDDAEDRFTVIARSASLITRRIRNLQKFAEAAALLDEPYDARTVVAASLSPTWSVVFEQRLDSLATGDPRRTLLIGLHRSRCSLISALTELSSVVGGMARLVTDVTQLAEQRGSFLAVSARIEGAHLVRDHPDIDSTVRDITEFLTRMTVAMVEVHERVSVLERTAAAALGGLPNADRASVEGSSEPSKQSSVRRAA